MTSGISSLVWPVQLNKKSNGTTGGTSFAPAHQPALRVDWVACAMTTPDVLAHDLDDDDALSKKAVGTRKFSLGL